MNSKKTKKEWLKDNYEYQLKETRYLDNNMQRLLKAANEDELLGLFRQIALWKEDRVVRIKSAKKINNKLKEITNIKSRKSIKNKKECIKSTVVQLMKCNGVGLPMASTILRFANPNIFPICDIRATRYLNMNDEFNKVLRNRDNLDDAAEFYLKYIEKCYIKYNKINDGSLKFKDFDRFAYQKDKEKK